MTDDKQPPEPKGDLPKRPDKPDSENKGDKTFSERGISKKG